jgi:hypothetical protein
MCLCPAHATARHCFRQGCPTPPHQHASPNCSSTPPPGTPPPQGPWLFTLDFPSYFPVMTHAKNRALREEMYRAYMTRASKGETAPGACTPRSCCACQQPCSSATAWCHASISLPCSAAQLTRIPTPYPAGELDNCPIIEQVLSLRQEKAKLLGYESFAQLSMASKMATLDKAEELLEELRAASYEAAKKDMKVRGVGVGVGCGCGCSMLPGDAATILIVWVTGLGSLGCPSTKCAMCP